MRKSKQQKKQKHTSSPSLNLDDEKESDRLALSDARILANRHEGSGRNLGRRFATKSSSGKELDVNYAKSSCTFTPHSAHEDENGRMVLDQNPFGKKRR